MEGFIDIHSHLLPGVDDGSVSMEQTMDMLKIAYSEGIRTMIATPHYQEGRYMHAVSYLEQKLSEVRASAEDMGIQVELLLGSEIYYSHGCVEHLKAKDIPTMAGTQCVLVEFSPMADSRYMINGLQEILLEGYNPILAHIERYDALRGEIDLVDKIIEMGVYVQVNAMSITGETGRTYQSATKKLLKNSMVHLVATDAHSDRTRSPKIKKCYEFLRKKYGEMAALELTRDNQQKLLSGQYI